MRIPASRCLGVLAAVAVGLGSQQTVTTTPPRFLNLVHQVLLPGHAGDYQALLASIATGYQKAGIASWWISTQSMTGPTSIDTLHLFDNFNEMETAIASMGSLLPQNPSLENDANRLLRENVSSENNVLLERRDELSFGPTSVNFARMRYLRINRVQVLPGQETDFAAAAQKQVAAASHDSYALPWVVYRVISGGPQAAYVIFTPLPALSALDTVAIRRSPFEDSVPNILSEVDSRLFTVQPGSSHVSDNFAAVDSTFWRGSN